MPLTLGILSNHDHNHDGLCLFWGLCRDLFHVRAAPSLESRSLESLLAKFVYVLARDEKVATEDKGFV